MKLQTVKGARDFYPEDMAVRNWIFDAWRRVSLRNGFVEYDGPIFEYMELYTAKSGEGIVSELFHFQDRGGRELAIRPEMTPTLARMIVARAASLPKPIKWFSMPRLCRAEKPQRGRLREFFQWNIDIVGEDDLAADAECIFVAIDFFREVGLTPNEMVMKINSRALVGEVLRIAGFDPANMDRMYALLDKRDKVPGEVFAEMVREQVADARQRETLGVLGEAKGPEGLDQVARLVGGDPGGQARMADMQRLLALLDRMGVGGYCRFDMGVVRGLAYYTGAVFEGFGKGGLRRAICGGGRYDQLLATLGGPPMSGVGFATSDVVIGDLLAELGRLPRGEAGVDAFVIDVDGESLDSVLAAVARIRAANLAASYSYRRQGLKKQLQQAAAAGARRVVLVGGEFDKTAKVGIKDMAAAVQREIDRDAFWSDPATALRGDGP